MKFSLLVVTTDRLYPAECLFRSLAAQTHKDFEVLFVHGEDCAADALALACKYADRLSIRTVPSPTPALSRARNAALPLLNGDCVAFPDDDCVYTPDTLERACALFLAHPEADVLLAAGKDLREDEEEARNYFSCGGSAPSNSLGREMIPLHPRLIFQRVYEGARGKSFPP
ncbi:MAG: glycosyltransferase family 2 protein, partial [Desulfovibrio sp.]|nr:glycosyltransferase family 2 protein [Desulfovibrio sp.]